MGAPLLGADTVADKEETGGIIPFPNKSLMVINARLVSVP